MAVFRSINGVARKVIGQYKGINNVARKIVAEYKGIGGVARQVFGNEELYLIRDGEYEVDFQNTSVWDTYPHTDSSSEFKVTDAEEYIEIYNKSTYMGGIITVDAIDLSRFSTLHIEADIRLYTQMSNALNRAAIGAYDSAAAAVGTSTSSGWEAGEGTIFYEDIFTGRDNGTSTIPVSQSHDISNYSDLGHIFAYITSYNYSSDWSRLRIKNLWLD